MDPVQLFIEYFVAPIDEKVGYNPVNTLAYAVLAIIAAYLIFRGFKKLGIKIDERFVYYILPFVLFGSAMRVVVDANILPYNYFTVTPGIYFMVGFITLAAVLIFNYIKKPKFLLTFGLTISIFPMLAILPLAKHAYHAFLILALVGVAVLIGFFVFDLLKIKNKRLPILLVASHALDGAATFITIDVFSHDMGLAYFEQHVLTNSIADFFGGFWAFYLIKVVFALAAAYLLETTKDLEKDEKYYVYLLLIIFGLAPGLRDLLRMLCGV